jgi:hypothetical protein
VRCRFFNDGTRHLQADWGEKPSRSTLRRGQLRPNPRPWS